MAIQLFGTPVSETLDYFLGRTAGPRKKPPVSDERLKIWARIVVSVLVIVGGTMVMLMSTNTQSQQAGAGFIGVVLGYWLK